MNGSLPPANSWNPAAPCDTPSDSPSIVNGITITGTPATIVAVSSGFSVWSITLNDGGSPPDFTIDHYDSAGNLIDHPIEVSGVDGSLTFNDPVYLSRDPLAPLEAATKEYVDGVSLIGQDAPSDGNTYGRTNTTWVNLAPPALGYLSLGGGYLSGAIGFNPPNPQQRFIQGSSPAPTSSPRWLMYFGDTTAESGGNVGSNFTLTSYPDSGGLSTAQLTITRTGVWTVPGQVNITGAINMASPGNLKIGGGNSGDALMSDGAGNVLWGSGGSGGGITDAPIDGNQYGRQNANWTIVPPPVIATDAPGTTAPYGRITGAWQALGAMATQGDAPSTSQYYARYNNGWVNLANSGLFLPIGGGTLTGALTISGAGSILNVSSAPIYLSAAPNNRVIAGFNAAGTQPRWALYYGDATAESGGNAGSNFSLSRYSDTGVIIDTPLSVSRASGLVSMPDGATVPTPAPGDNSSLAANTSWVNAAIAAIPPPPQPTPPIGENRIINGNFAINQRAYASGAGIAAAAYGHDRWKAGASGCSYTFTAALPDTTITITAGSLTQVIEAGMIEGGVYTLSWTGTAQGRVYQGTPTGAYAPSPIVTASLAAGVNTIVELNTGTVVRVKLEIGSVATPFNRQTMAKSLADCQRYYQVGSWGLAGNAAAGVSELSFSALPVVMRTSPTVGYGIEGSANLNAAEPTVIAAATLQTYALASNNGGYSVNGSYILDAEL